jgi:peptidoglycan/LPS O-acetylase OafA/YrhL
MKSLLQIPSSLSRLSPGWFRLFLAVVVVLFHTSKFVFFGFWAVFVFFILSGYWIAEMYREKYSEVERPFITFELSRILRIFPTFLACALLAALVIGSGYGDLERKTLEDPVWLARSLAMFGASSLTPRLIETQWSLDIEVQFYLFFPLLFATMRKPHAVKVAICTLYLFLLLLAFGFAHSLAVYLPFFMAGVLVSELKWRSSKLTLDISLALAFIVLGFLAINPETRSSILTQGRVELAGTNVTRLVDTLLALLAIPFLSINVRNKESKLGAHAGNLSFPLYLVHWIVLGPYVAFCGEMSMRDRLPYFALYLLACFAVSIVIYRFVDRPVDAWRRALIRKSGANAPVAAAT